MSSLDNECANMIYCPQVNQCTRIFSEYILYVYVYVCMYVYMCMYACMYVRMFVCIIVCMRVYVCMYVCTYVCLYVCMYVYVCICVRLTCSGVPHAAVHSLSCSSVSNVKCYSPSTENS